MDPTSEASKTSLGLLMEGDLEVNTIVELAAALDMGASLPILERDLALLTASGRWRPGRPDPDEIVPGDLPILRGIIANAHIGEMGQQALRHSWPDRLDRTTTPSHLHILASGASALHRSSLFHLEAETAIGLLSSAPPDDTTMSSIRLPFHTVFVAFGKELELPEDTVWPPGVGELDMPVALNRGFTRTTEQALIALGGALTGIIIGSGPDGTGIDDLVFWVVSTNPDPDSPSLIERTDRQRTVIAGSRRTSAWSHIIDNVAAAVAWMDWTEPPDLDLPPVGSKQWRKAVRTSQFRKKEPKGAGARVRTISVDRSRKPEPQGGAGNRRSSPVTHLRSGHWRSARVATRDDRGVIVGDISGERGVDWHYEGRWLPPTVVNPGGSRDDRTVVYTVPTPHH